MCSGPNSTRARKNFNDNEAGLLANSHRSPWGLPAKKLAVTENCENSASDMWGKYSSGFCPGFSPVFPFQPPVERVLVVATTLSRCKVRHYFSHHQIFKA